MKFLLDTNIVAHFLRGAFRIDEKIRSVGLENCFISEITLAELEFGIENSHPDWQNRQREAFAFFVETFEGRVLPLRPAFSIYAKNRARLRRLGTPVSDFDLLIGATAISQNMTLATENVADLSRIEGVLIENWVNRGI